MQLIVEGKNVDVEGTVAVTFQVASVAQIKDIKVTHTNNLKAPKTKNNIQIFENAHTVQASGEVPYKSLGCQLIGRGSLLLSGSLILDRADEYFNLQFYSGNKPFFEKIGDKTIQDLDLFDLVHNRSFANITGSRNNDEGYIYAFIDYPEISTVSDSSRTVTVTHLLPCVYVHDLISRIADEAGYTLKGKVFELGNIYNDLYKRLIVPTQGINIGIAHFIASAFAEPQSIFPVEDVEFTDIVDPYENNVSGGLMDVGRPVVPTINGSPSPMFVWSYRHSFAFKGTIRVALTAQIFSSSPFTYTFELFIGNGASKKTVTNTVNAVGFTNVQINFDIIGVNVGALEDIYILNTASSGAGTLTILSGTFDVNDISEATSPLFGNTMDIAANLPKVKQKDLFKTVLSFIAGITDNDALAGEVRIFSTQELEDNKSEAIDITGYISDEGEDMGYRIEGYGQKTWYKYKEDDSVPAGYGDGYIEIADENLPLEETQIELPFAATEMADRFSSDYYCPMINIVEEVSVNSITKIGKVQPRILLLDRRDADPVTYTSGGLSQNISDNLPFCYFHDPDKDYTLHFQSILDNYYNTLKAILTQTKITTLHIKWTEALLSALDFSIPFYSRKHHQYFKLEKIENYTGGVTKTIMTRL